MWRSCRSWCARLSAWSGATETICVCVSLINPRMGTPAQSSATPVLGGLAEFERHLILTRTAEGRTRAQANGVRFGHRPTLTSYQRAEALRRRAAGETLTEIAKSMNVSHMTIARGTSNGAADDQG
jgi:Homeodomain-like domain/Resolvase, N terminal domain